MNWHRLTSSDPPCPACGRTADGCVLSPDGSACLCVRTPSERHRPTGYIHLLKPGQWQAGPATVDIAPPPIDYTQLAQHFAAAGQQYLHIHAAELGVCIDSLRELGVGWNCWEACWTWPMSTLNELGEQITVGILRRFQNGSKLLMPGHRAGVYLPQNVPIMHRLWIVEGGSDCAAALSLGLPAIGRFSCGHGRYEISRIIKEMLTTDVVVVGDAGGPAELDGAERLAQQLRKYCPTRLIFPPNEIKDLRQWVAAGATKEHLLAAANRTGETNHATYAHL